MRSVSRFLKAARTSATLSLFTLLSLVPLACGQPGASFGDAGLELASEDPEEARAEDAPPHPSLKDLGPAGRRVTLMVLPGDAAVEVDGIAVRRRSGVVELTGKVGEAHRLRVFKGTLSVERDVTVQEAGASPPLLDLNARLPRAANAGGAAGVPGVAPLLHDKFE